MSILLTVSVIFIMFYFVLRTRGIHVWLLSYLKHRLRIIFLKKKYPIHVMFCFADHYEPRWKTNDPEVETRRVDRWCSEYPELAGHHKDADGCFPKHSFFFPEEEYHKDHLDKLSHLCDQGFGEVEIHLHHHDDNEANFRKTIAGFKDTLSNTHGQLSRDKSGKTGFAFIHGNWALDNSDPDGDNCGINNEISILRDEACFVDMTFPSAPHLTQPRTVNSIYMATDNPDKPKSHDTGEDVSIHGMPEGDLLLIQGPLCFNWKSRKLGVLPKIENSDIRYLQPPDEHRIDLWIKQHIHVRGRPEWLFVKIHTHGAQEPDMDVLLGKPVDMMFDYLEKKYNDGDKYVLHYVSAREMYNIVKAASDGMSGNPNDYRDYTFTK